MKLKHTFSLLMVCMIGLFWTQSVNAAETQVHLHKRLFVNQEAPGQINQSGELGNADLLKDS